MNQIFKLPIEYDKYKKTISQKLNNDLELITVIHMLSHFLINSALVPIDK